MRRRTEVEVIDTVNATDQEREAFIEAAVAFEEAINSQIFWNNVQIVYNTWTYNNGLTFSEFKSLVLSGRDQYETKDDWSIRIKVHFYYSWRNVVGYTKPSTWFTWINRKLFKGFDISDIAGNQGHEYCHNLGLDHPNTDRQSVTYQFGYKLRDHVAIMRNLSTKPQVLKRSWWSRITQFFRGLF